MEKNQSLFSQDQAMRSIQLLDKVEKPQQTLDYEIHGMSSLTSNTAIGAEPQGPGQASSKA